jgi:argininosuccinate synthase
MKPKIVLAYSGGLDTSVILHWLVHYKGYEVICFIADVGQEEDFEQLEKRALQIGANKVFIQNLQKEFIEDFVFQALKCNAVYEGSYLLGTSLARPLIAQKQVDCALQEGATMLAHGATGKGNDQVRFELAYACLMPQAQIISPWKDPEFLAQFQGRKDLIAYAHTYKIPVNATATKLYSIDENLMHTSYESGILEDPGFAPDESMFKKTTCLYKAPDKPVKISILFKQGIPVEITNYTQGLSITGPVNLFKYLNELAGLYGIGRVDIVENRFVGIKSRGVYETPAGTVLYKAHKDIESITLDKEVAHLKEALALHVAKLIYNGFWFSPEMEFLMCAINQSQKNVDGVVHMILYKGNVVITGRSSVCSLYDAAVASMNETGSYDQSDAKGFITIHALRLKQINKGKNNG